MELDIEPLHKPFQAVYLKGELIGMNIEPGDHLWSLNIKRALVGLLQLKLNNLDQPSFTTQEVCYTFY